MEMASFSFDWGWGGDVEWIGVSRFWHVLARGGTVQI